MRAVKGSLGHSLERDRLRDGGKGALDSSPLSVVLADADTIHSEKQPVPYLVRFEQPSEPYRPISSANKYIFDS
jgi:hypothetical protein